MNPGNGDWLDAATVRGVELCGLAGGLISPTLRLSRLLPLTAILVVLTVFFVHDSIPIAQAQLDSTEGICDRTQEVQDAILGELAGVSDCTNVTDSHLAGINELIEWRFTSAQAIKSDDFAGLSALTDLELGQRPDLRASRGRIRGT